jgi:hypothetical protein
MTVKRRKSKMSLDKAILEVVESKLKDGFMEKMIEEQLERGIKNSLESAFGSYGDVTKVIEKKIKEVIIPSLERYDYSEYVTKMDHVLVDMLKRTALPHKKMVENFKDLVSFEAPAVVGITDIFEKWKTFVSKNVSTDKLEICYDEEPTYYDVDVTMEIESNPNERSWSSREETDVIFECEQDPTMNRSIKLYRWKDGALQGKTYLDYNEDHMLSSLRDLDEFTIFLMQLRQSLTDIKVGDFSYETDYVEVEERPEPEWN